jgi:hypothetical protein
MSLLYGSARSRRQAQRPSLVVLQSGAPLPAGVALRPFCRLVTWDSHGQAARHVKVFGVLPVSPCQLPRGDQSDSPLEWRRAGVLTKRTHPAPRVWRAPCRRRNRRHVSPLGLCVRVEGSVAGSPARRPFRAGRRRRLGVEGKGRPHATRRESAEREHGAAGAPAAGPSGVVPSCRRNPGGKLAISLIRLVPVTEKEIVVVVRGEVKCGADAVPLLCPSVRLGTIRQAFARFPSQG